MILIMGGNFVISVVQLRSQFEQQLQNRAEEAATSLALSMVHSVDNQDDATIRSLIDVVFDRGDFQSIYFRYVDQRPEISRGMKAPDAHSALHHLGWMARQFNRMLRLKPAVAQASVTQGWRQLGELTVQVSTASVAEHFWRLALADAAWYALMTFVTLYCVHLLLTLQLKPLHLLLRRLDGLGKGQFRALNGESLSRHPPVKEFEQLTQAIEVLSQRLEQSYAEHSDTIQSLQRNHYEDTLTGLGNLKSWDRFVQHWMSPEVFAPCWMMLIQVENLHHINRRLGKPEGDRLLIQMAKHLKQSVELEHENVHIARGVGGEYWVCCPSPISRQFQQPAEVILRRLWQLPLVNQMEARMRAAVIPLAHITQIHVIKHQLDRLIRRAHDSHTDWLVDEPDQLAITNWVQWQQRLAKALRENQIELFVQPLYAYEPDGDGVSITLAGVKQQQRILQYEIHCRLCCNGQPSMRAGAFWPMVEELGLAADFDRLIVEVFLQHSAVRSTGGQWVINLSGQSLMSTDFRQWFLETVLTSEQLKHVQLMLEFSEFTLAKTLKSSIHRHPTSVSQPQAELDDTMTQEGDAAMEWLYTLSKKGIGLSVDHLGTSGQSFGFIAHFPIKQGKIERRYIHRIQHQPDSALFVTGMANILHSQHAKCFVEGVETEEEFQSLASLNINGLMGYGVEEPKALIELG